MQVVSISPDEPRDDRLAQAVAILESGGLLALPTETFYGLAVDAANLSALRRLNRVKRKREESPLLLLLGQRGHLDAVMDRRPEALDGLVERFWPGPLTLVVPALAGLPSDVAAGRGSVAVRLPGLTLPRRLALALGRPITGVSANLHGQPPCRTALEVATVLAGEVDCVLDGGPTAGGAPSTIVDLTVSPPRVLREGILPSAALRAVLPELVEAPAR